jgi:hypothetical protein
VPFSVLPRNVCGTRGELGRVAPHTGLFFECGPFDRVYRTERVFVAQENGHLVKNRLYPIIDRVNANLKEVSAREWARESLFDVVTDLLQLRKGVFHTHYSKGSVTDKLA